MDQDLSHIFPLEPMFRRYPWLAVVLVLLAYVVGAVLDGTPQ
jgi:hypothetical protein